MCDKGKFSPNSYADICSCQDAQLEYVHIAVLVCIPQMLADYDESRLQIGMSGNFQGTAARVVGKSNGRLLVGSSPSKTQMHLSRWFIVSEETESVPAGILSQERLA